MEDPVRVDPMPEGAKLWVVDERRLTLSPLGTRESLPMDSIYIGRAHWSGGKIRFVLQTPGLLFALRLCPQVLTLDLEPRMSEAMSRVLKWETVTLGERPAKEDGGEA